MRWKDALGFGAAAWLFSGVCASAQTIDFTQHTLKNGLRVILSEDHTAPTFSLSITYNVGSRDERPGRAGFAHLFEHMMFQGSENVGKGEHLAVVTLNGGSANGTTNQFRTSYFETLPSIALSEIFREFQRLSDEPVPTAELEERKRKLVARFALPLESPTSPMGNELTIKAFGFPEDYWETYPDKVMAVTAGDVQRVARKYINAKTMQIVAVGDAGVTKAILAKYGPVETYDVNGKRMN